MADLLAVAIGVTLGVLASVPFALAIASVSPHPVGADDCRDVMVIDVEPIDGDQEEI